MTKPGESIESRFANAWHADGNPGRMTFILCVVGSVFLGLRISLTLMGFVYILELSLLGTIAFSFWWWRWHTRRRHDKAQEAYALRKELGEFEKVETKLRIKEARRAGKFLTWESRK
ncbi:MAG: hypothetical protein AAFV74_16665 [Pseudomonadota bacterium]